MLDKVLLGLIFERPKSGYELAKDLERWPILGLSASQGSVHPALQALLRAGYVEQHEERDGARVRKAYTPTGAGREALLEWLASPIPLPRSRDEATYRLPFLRHLGSSAAKRVFEEYLERLGDFVGELDGERRAHKGGRAELSAAEAARAADELLLVEFARSHAKFLSKWHKRKPLKRLGSAKASSKKT